MISKNIFLALFANPAQSDSPVEKCIFFESKRHPKGNGHLLYLMILINNGTWNTYTFIKTTYIKKLLLDFIKAFDSVNHPPYRSTVSIVI